VPDGVREVAQIVVHQMHIGRLDSDVVLLLTKGYSNVSLNMWIRPPSGSEGRDMPTTTANPNNALREKGDVRVRFGAGVSKPPDSRLGPRLASAPRSA
jgi:hypothetical protein